MNKRLKIFLILPLTLIIFGCSDSSLNYGSIVSEMNQNPIASQDESFSSLNPISTLKQDQNFEFKIES